MALQVATKRVPAILVNWTFSVLPVTPTLLRATALGSYTTVCSSGGTQLVAGILDSPGINPLGFSLLNKQYGFRVRQSTLKG